MARRTTKYRLASTAWLYTPGLVQRIRAHELVEARLRMLLAAFPELSPKAAAKILDGDFRVEGEDVIVEA